jgi:Fe-S cluster biosynthesis and repair protein YggX
MQFRKYQHIERYGKTETEGIELGKVYIFSKIDGTNSQLYLDDEGNLKAGSRNRELTLGNDNAGFYAYALSQPNFKAYLEKHPTHRLFGEFLVPHSLRTYRDSAWRRLYIFDVCVDREDGELEYIPYDVYKPLLEEFGIDYIPPIATMINGSYEHFMQMLDKNLFLIEDGKGVGEGIVIKNYDYQNRFGRQTWAKIVTNEFKERNTKVMGYNTIKTETVIEQKIVDEYCTSSLIEKEFAKIVNENDGWNSKMIPQLLGKVYYAIVTEEIWNIVKENKMPTINFKTLNALVINKIKQIKQDLF